MESSETLICSKRLRNLSAHLLRGFSKIPTPLLPLRLLLPQVLIMPYEIMDGNARDINISVVYTKALS